MNDIERIVSTFGVSEPIFKIRLNGTDDLTFDVKNQYAPPKTDDPVYELIASRWRENLNKQKRCFEGYVDVEGVYSKMRTVIRVVLLNSSPLKNPKQSKLYHWLEDHRSVYNDP